MASGFINGEFVELIRYSEAHMRAYVLADRALRPSGEPDCSGDPNSCPNNEGFGCACSSGRASIEPSGAANRQLFVLDAKGRPASWVPELSEFVIAIQNEARYVSVGWVEEHRLEALAEEGWAAVELNKAKRWNDDVQLYKLSVPSASESRTDAPTESLEAPQDPVAWVIEYKAKGAQRRDVFLHQAIGDFRILDPDATSTPLYRRAPNLDALEGISVPNGYKLLRRMPNAEMVEAGRVAMEPEKFVSHCRALWVWNAMWDAAPTVAQTAEDYGAALADPTDSEISAAGRFDDWRKQIRKEGGAA